MRVAILDPLRKSHGFRLKQENTEGRTAAAHALKTRLGWARRDWEDAVGASVRLLMRPQFLRSTGAQNPRQAQILEGLVRPTGGIQARAFSIWSGGVYRMVQLTDPALRRATIVWARVVYRNLLFLEEMCSAGHADESLQALRQQLIWQDGTVYRELFGLVYEGRIEEACRYALRIHTGALHEKGACVGSVCSFIWHSVQDTID